MEALKRLGNNLAKLINVKTIVTFAVTAIFAVLALDGRIEANVVMTVVTMVISFYFGTQHEKTDAAVSPMAATVDAEE